ncbi:MAG: CapA family protein [Rikenellaceae bacterium]|nr:CapA family protein [Rikenellaceae bacterium]
MKTFLSILYAALLASLVAGEVLYVERVVPLRSLVTTATNMALQSPPSVRRAKIVFGGDVMAHTPQLSAAQTADGYSFDRSFEYVAPILKQADLAVVNLETTLSRRPPYTGYPMFRTPAELAVTMQYAGVDVAALANNHICDRGASGITTTISVLDSLKINYMGAYADSMTRQPLYVSAADITVAMLNYTYGTNGLPTPRGMVVNRIDTVQMAADIAAIDRECVDVVCVMLHWGEEYQRRPNRAQRAVAEFCRRQGVELIIGSHPHVAQPIECDSATRWATVYSLGNMVSNQQWRYSDGGLLAEVTVSRVDNAAPSIAVRPIPIWVLCPDYRIVPQSVGDTLTMSSAARYRYTQFINDCRTLLKN